MRNGLFGILLTCFLAVSAAHAAEAVAPDVLAKNVTEEVLAILRADKAIQAGDSRKAADLIETTILPHFNFSAMTRLAVGKNWAQASPEQRKALTNEFRTPHTTGSHLHRVAHAVSRPDHRVPATETQAERHRCRREIDDQAGRR